MIGGVNAFLILHLFRAFVSMLEGSSGWNKEGILTICKQTHLMIGDARAQMLSEIGRSGKGAKQNMVLYPGIMYLAI